MWVHSGSVDEMGRASFDFSDETVVVTGGSSGIGRAIALAFGESGATVVNADVREEPKDVDAETPTHEAVSARGGRGEYVETDVSERSDLETAVEAAREFGGVDVMVNNAGWFHRASMFEVSEETFERIHRINAKGVFFGTQVAAADMVDRGVAGCVVNTASISSTHAQADQVPYDSTKGGIRMITRGTALECAPHGIRVNAVAPGHIVTEFGAGSEEKEASVEAGETVKPIPLDRPGYPEDISGAALFLASDAASYVTGEMVYVDGGWQVF
jgi:NAD(P)-dependent dehydrogenase (short-subunit alcohol dehydrogenase family)